MADTDGRRRRSENSRDRIVAAMLELVAEGHITPAAEQVAARAGIGLRTVFRQFKDMEGLYAAMTRRLSRHYEMWLSPFEAPDWRGRLDEVIVWRLTTYECLLPFKRAGDAHRHMSPAIRTEHDRILAVMRARLQSILPAAIADDPVAFEALDLLLSFDAWQRLRDDQALSVERANAVVQVAVARIVDPRSS